MLTATIIVAISVALGVGLSGGGPEPYQETLDNWDKAIKKYVDDDAREEQAKTVLKAAVKSVKDSEKVVDEALKKYFAVDRGYNATAEEYEAAIKALDDVWIIADKQLIDERFNMKEVLTDQEWTDSIKYLKKKMKKVSKDVDKGVKKLEKKQIKAEKKLAKKEKKAAEK